MNIVASPSQYAAENGIGPEDVSVLWRDLPGRGFDVELLLKNRIVTAAAVSPDHTPFDMLRTSLAHTMQQNSWSTVAITSPTAECGKTLVAVNLAFSLARHRERRTLLVDLDLRRPHIAKTLGLKAPPLLEKFLRGRSTRQDAVVRYGDNLAVLANGEAVSSASELLQATMTAEVLARLREELRPDIVIFDMPPMLAADDVLAFAPNIDATLLVVAAEATRASEADICERELSQRTNMLGIVLNKCRYMPGRYEY